MKKILVIPDNNNLDKLLSTKIDGLLLPIKDLACNFSDYFTITEIKKILKKSNKEISVILNKIIHNEDLPFLEETIKELDKLDIKRILFYDLSVMNVCNRLNIKKELAIYQEHLNASNNSNNFYKKRGINYTVITNDITKEEINEISKNINVMLISYGYLPIFYSRRYLVSNYLKYIAKDKKNNLYFIKHNNDKYLIMEETSGCAIFTSKPINLINEIDDINATDLIINSFNIEDSTLLKVVNDYCNNNKNKEKNYIGFLKEKTVYKVEDYE